MGKGYLKQTWEDVRTSPHWLRTCLKLVGLSCIPVFGTMVVCGFLYDWARDAAWGVRSPLPEKIFDGRRGPVLPVGAMVWLISFVYSLVPPVFMGMGLFITRGLAYPHLPFAALVAFGISLLTIVLSLVIVPFVLIGCMRAAIYQRLSAGFQIGCVWKMMRAESLGCLRVVGLYFALFAGGLFVTGVLVGIIAGVGALLGIIVGVGGIAASRATASVPAVFFGALLFAVVLGVGSVLVVALYSTALSLFSIRATGLWTALFDVPQWRGQDDPLPFERAGQQH